LWRQNEVHIVQRWASVLAPGTILDAGSGTGLHRPVLESTGHRVIGVDLSPEMLMIQVGANPNALVAQAKIEALPFQGSSFDYVLCTRVLSHIQSPTPVFCEFARVSKPGAVLLITDVHPEHRYSEMSIPTNTERISIQIFKHSIRQIKNTAKANGFDLLELKEFRLDDLIWKPPIENFESVYDEPERPIFYTFTLRRS
jgi:ubiquinone/menaquinone biosynthesis C-methylase UbiE